LFASSLQRCTGFRIERRRADARRAERGMTYDIMSGGRSGLGRFHGLHEIGLETTRPVRRPAVVLHSHISANLR
jgi:hypothetical protein